MIRRRASRLRHWLGVNGPALDDTVEEADAALDLIRSLGARWVRLDFDWPTLATSSSRRARAFQLVADARARRLSVLAVIGYRPTTATALDPEAGGNSWQLTPTAADAVEVRALRSIIVDLIRAGVDAFEGWNEWNHEGFSNPPDPDVMAVYHQALAETIARASWEAAQPVAVLVGGTAPATLYAHDAYSQLLTTADGAFVGTHPAHHPYAWSYDPHAAGNVAQEWNALRYQPAVIWAEWLAAHGTAARVWGTEIGWPDSIDDQVERATLDLAWWAEGINDGAFGPIFVYTARSDAVTGVDGEQFGLRDADGLEKTALTAAIRQAGAIQLDGVTL